MNILITGSSGFIGQKMLAKIDQSHNVLVIASTKEANHKKNKQGFSICTIYDLNFEKTLIDFNPDILFHIAGNSSHQTDINSIDKLIDSNISFGTKILESLTKVRLKKFVYFNTSLAYEKNNQNANNLYALTKIEFLNFILFYQKKMKFELHNLILYNVYGKGDRNKKAINYIIESLNAEQPIKMSPGNQVLDLIHVDDIINYCFDLINEKSCIHSKINNTHLGTGIGKSLKEVAKEIELISSKKANIIWGGIPYRFDEKMVNVSPSDATNKWTPTIHFEDGIKKLIN